MRLFRIFPVLVLAFSLMFISGCKDPKKDDVKTGNLTIQLKAKYGTQDFVLNSSTLNTDQAGRQIQFNTLQFYLSHITLVTDSGDVEVKDVAFFDFTKPATLSVTADKLLGNYKGIKFGCGVDSIQNAVDPLTASGALAGSNGMYWPWLKYQFEILEARMDTIPGETRLPYFFPQYHVGGDAFYRHTQLTNNFSVTAGQTTTLTVYLDIDKMFDGAGALDIINESYSQSTTDNAKEIAIANKFADNFAKAFSIQ